MNGDIFLPLGGFDLNNADNRGKLLNGSVNFGNLSQRAIGQRAFHWSTSSRVR